MRRPKKSSGAGIRADKAKPQVKSPATRAATRRGAATTKKQVSAKRSTKRIAQNPTNEELLDEIAKLTDTVKKLRAERKEAQAKLKHALEEIAEIKEDIETATGEQENKIDYLKDCLTTERNGRLKAEALVDELQRPGRLAQEAREREEEDQLKRCQEAVRRYLADNQALNAEIERLRTELIPSSPKRDL